MRRLIGWSRPVAFLALCVAGGTGGARIARPRGALLRPTLRMTVDDSRGAGAPRSADERRADGFGRRVAEAKERVRLATVSVARADRFVDFGDALIGFTLVLGVATILLGAPGAALLGADASDWGLLSAKFYMNGLHSRVYIEQFASSGAQDTHVIFGAGLPQLGTLVATGFGGGYLARMAWAVTKMLSRDPFLEQPGADGSGPPEAGGAGAALAAAPPTSVWLLQVAVRGAPPAGAREADRAGAAESGGLALLWQQYAERCAETGMSATGSSAGGASGGAAADAAARAKRAADAADACVALIRCASAWEGARVSRLEAPSAPGAAQRAISRIAIEEQCRAPQADPGPARARPSGAAAAGERAPRAGAADYLVVSVLVATAAELDVPESVHSVAQTRDALLEIAGALRAGGGDDTLHSADFASAVRADGQGGRPMGSRDHLYLLYPSLCPL